MTPLALNVWRWRATQPPGLRDLFDDFVAAETPRRQKADGGYVLTGVEHGARLPARHARALRAIVTAANELPAPPRPPVGPLPIPYPRLSRARTETVDNNETITIHGARTETVSLNECLHMLSRLPLWLETSFAR